MNFLFMFSNSFYKNKWLHPRWPCLGEVLWSGNFNCFPIIPLSFWGKQVFSYLWYRLDLLPGFEKVDIFSWGCICSIYGCSIDSLDNLKYLIMASSINSIAHRLKQLLRRCWKESHPKHRGHKGVLLLPCVWKFTGLSKLSYTVWTKNPIRKKTARKRYSTTVNSASLAKLKSSTQCLPEPIFEGDAVIHFLANPAVEK